MFCSLVAAGCVYLYMFMNNTTEMDSKMRNASDPVNNQICLYRRRGRLFLLSVSQAENHSIEPHIGQPRDNTLSAVHSCTQPHSHERSSTVIDLIGDHLTASDLYRYATV